jgi:CubicO group peptidase (beta-lactamase class C family)
MTIERAPIDALVRSYAADHHCPTIAWGVVVDGVLAVWGTVGPNAPQLDEHSVYRIASMTKSFSAAATLLLRDEGALGLDDPVALHDPRLDALRSPTSDAPPIRVRDLLAMSSGLVTDDPWADRHLDLSDDEFDGIVATGCAFGEPTGSAYEYSNFGFAVLGRVVERACGRPIQDVVTERLLRPLGMTSTTWDPPDHDRWLRPMRRLDDTFVEERATPGDGLLAPMGGLWSTVSDLARWVAWLDDAFPARDGPDDGPLSRASRREMQTVQRWVGWRTIRGVRAPSGYGYGLRVQFEEQLGRMVTHSGGFPGYGSTMRWLPGRRVGVVALSNVTYAPDDRARVPDPRPAARPGRRAARGASGHGAGARRSGASRRVARRLVGRGSRRALHRQRGMGRQLRAAPCSRGRTAPAHPRPGGRDQRRPRTRPAAPPAMAAP